MDSFKDFKPLIPDDESSLVEGGLRHEDNMVHVVVQAGDVGDNGARSQPNKQPSELRYSVLSSIELVDSTVLGSGETPETLSCSGLVRHLPGHDTMYGEPNACSTGFSFLQPELIDTLNSTEEETLKDDGFNGKLTTTKADISQYTISDGSDSRESPSYSPAILESSGKTDANVLCRLDFELLNNDGRQTSLSQHSLDSQGSEGSTLSQHLMMVSDAAGLLSSFDSLIQSATDNRISASQLRVVDAYSGSTRGKSPAPLKDRSGNSLPQFSIVDVFVGSGTVDVNSESRTGALPQFEIVDAVYGCTKPPTENFDARNSNLLTEQIDFSAVKVPQSISTRCDVESFAEDVENTSLPTHLHTIPAKSTATKLTDASNLDKSPSGILLPVAAMRDDQLSSGSVSCPDSVCPVITSSDSNQPVVTEMVVSKSRDDVRNLGTLVEGHVNAKGKSGYMFNRMLLKDREDGMLAKIKKPRVWMPLEIDKSSDSESGVSSLNKQHNGHNDFGIAGKDNPLQDMEMQKAREVNNFASSIPSFPLKSNKMENSLRLSANVLHADIGDTLVHSLRVPLGSSVPIMRENREAVEKIHALQGVLDSEERSDSGRASRGSTVASFEPDQDLEKYDLKSGVGCFPLEEKLRKMSDQDSGGKCDRNTMSIRDELRIAFKNLCDDVGEEEIANISRNMIGRSGFGKSSSCSSCTSLSPAISLCSIKHLHGDGDVRNASLRTVSRCSVGDSVKDFDAPVNPLIANYQSCEDLNMRQEPIGAATEDLKATFLISSADLKILNSSSKMKFVKKDSFSEDSDGSDVDKVQKLYRSYLDDDFKSNEKAVTVENLSESSERKGEGSCLDDSEERKIHESDDWKRSTLMKSEVISGREEIISSIEKLERSSTDIEKFTAPEAFEAPCHIMETFDKEIAAEVPDDLLASSLPSSGFSGSDVDNSLSEDVRQILLKYGRRFPKFIPLHGTDLNAGRESPGIMSEIGETPGAQNDAPRPENKSRHLVEVNCESLSESSDDTLGKRVGALLSKTSETFALNDKVDCVPPPKPSSCQSSVASSGTGSVDYDVLQRDLDELEMSLDSMKKRDLDGHFAHPTSIHNNLFQRTNKTAYDNGQAALCGSHLQLLGRNLLDVDRMGEGKDGLAREMRQQASVLGHSVAPLPHSEDALFLSNQIKFTDGMRTPVSHDSLSNTIPIGSPVKDVTVAAEDEMDRLSRCRISSLPASFTGADDSASTRSERQVLANVVTKRGSSYGGISLSDLSEMRSLDGAEGGDIAVRRVSDVSQGSTVQSSEVGGLGRNLAMRNAAVTGVDGGDNQSSSGYSGSGSLVRSDASLSSGATFAAGRSSVLSGIRGQMRVTELESEFGQKPKSCGFASAVKSQMEIKRSLLLGENHDQSLMSRGLLLSNPMAKLGNDYEKTETKSISHMLNIDENSNDVSSCEFHPVDNRASRSLPAAVLSRNRDSDELQLKLDDVQCKKTLGNGVPGLEYIRTNQVNVGIDNNSTSDLEDSVISFEAHVDKSCAQVLTGESGRADPVSEVHESDSFEDILQKSMPDRPVGFEGQIEEIYDGKSEKDIEYRHRNEMGKSHLVEDLTDSDTDRHLTNANESRNRFVSPLKRTYTLKDFSKGTLNDSQDSSGTLVSSESLVTDNVDSALKLDDRMRPSEDQSDLDSQSRDDPVSSNGALRTSLTTVTSLRDSTDSDRNSVLDHKGTNEAMMPVKLPAIVPYKPASSSEVYYVDSGPEEGSQSAAVSDATVESTHPSSDDARAPNFPVNVLGSRSDAPMDVMTLKNKTGHAFVRSTVTNLSNISERSEVGNLSSSKLNQLLAEKSRKQELQQLQEKTRNWVDGISASLPDMCTPIRVDKASRTSLSESEIVARSKDRIVTGLASGTDGSEQPLPRRLLTDAYGRSDRAADEIGNYQHQPGSFGRADALPASGGCALAGSEIRVERSRPGVKTLDFGDYIANDRLLFEMNKHFSQQLPGDGGGGIGGVGGCSGGGGGSESKGLNPEQLSAQLENHSGMTAEIRALLEKYAEKGVSEKYDGKDKKKLLPLLQSLDSSNKQQSPAEAEVEKTQNFNSVTAKVTEPTEKTAATGVSRDEFTKRLWERFHESGQSSSCESEYNDRRAHSSVMRLVSIMKNPTHHFVKHLQSEREERSKTDEELTAVDLSGSHSVAGISMRSAESCRTYTIEAGQVRSHGLESASGTKDERADNSNEGQGQRTGGKDSGDQRSRSSGSKPGICIKRLSANGAAGEKSSSDDDRPRQKNLPAWQEFGDFEVSKRSTEKKRADLDRAKSAVVESKRAWTIVVDDETLPVVPENAVLENASSNLTRSSLDEADKHATHSSAATHRFSDDPKLLRLQQKIAHQKEKYRRAYIREHRRKLKIAQLEMRYQSEAGADASGVGSSLESFSRPPSVGVDSTTAASTASESSAVCPSCSESDGGACICVRLKSKHSVVKQSEETPSRAKPKASPPQKKPRESSAPAIVLDLREVDYSEGGQRKRESSPRSRRPHAGHTRQPAARSPSKSSRTLAAKSPVRRTASHGVSTETRSPFFPVAKSGMQISDTTRKSSADDTRKGTKSTRSDFGMTFPTPRQEVEKCSKGVQTIAPGKVQSPRKPYRGSRPHDVGVISIPVAGKMRVKNPCGDLHLHGSLVSDVSVQHGHSHQVKHRTKSHKSKQRKPLPRGISWFVPLKEAIFNKDQELDHFGYHGVSSDWMSDKPFRCDGADKENSALSKLSSVTVTKEATKDYDQVSCDVLRENAFNSLNNSNSTKIIWKSGEHFPFGSGEEAVIPSLQQCFRERMQTFMLRSQQRERHIALRAEERRMKEMLKKQHLQLIGNALKGTSASRRDPISEQLFKPRKRWFTKQQMRTMTYRRYRNLPEVMKMVEEKQKSEQFRANRQRVQMFKQRVLNHVLGEKNKRVAA